MQNHYLWGLSQGIKECGEAGSKDFGFELHLEFLVEVGIWCFWWFSTVSAQSHLFVIRITKKLIVSMILTNTEVVDIKQIINHS